MNDPRVHDKGKPTTTGQQKTDELARKRLDADSQQGQSQATRLKAADASGRKKKNS